MCIAIIATKDNANIALEYFTIVNGAQHHPKHEVIVKSCQDLLVSIVC